MKACQVYKLRMLSPAHFGRRGVGMEESAESFPSDSLFAALASALRATDGLEGVGAFLKPFEGGDPPFLLSSAFPYAGEVLLYPRPQLPTPGLAPEEQEPKVRKRLKKVHYVSQGILKAWLEGQSLKGQTGDQCLRKDGIWATQEEAKGLPERIWAQEAVHRVTVDRVTSASEVYRVGRTWFASGCGLYFLVSWRDETYRPYLERALHHLADAGLGGERSAGHGQFQLEKPQQVELPGAREGGRLMTLSRYHPTLEELQAGVLGEGASYRLEVSRGWIGSPEGSARRRRNLRMIREGSILAEVGEGPYGDLTDVGPKDGSLGHKVYRYGWAFPVGVGKEELYGQ